MLFLINEQKKKTSKWWKWLCRVFLVDDEVVDITKRMSEITKREKQYDWINLTIHYWNWTWTMILTEALKVHRGNDIEIKDVSIF